MDLGSLQDSREIDALCEPVPGFDKWAGCFVDEARWERHKSRLEELDRKSADLFDRSREVVKRATAIDTGAIDGLYEVNRDFTIAVAMNAGGWEAKLIERAEGTRALIESQLHGYDYLLDLATGTVPFVETWVRKLHQEICAGQQTYRLLTGGAGWQDEQLPLGEYKNYPNHVTNNGVVRAYAPVDRVSAEVHRLCEELGSESFLGAHPILQGAYAHSALLWIHPFSGGNGRVARAVASFYTLRALSIPIMFLMDRQKEYFACLRLTDDGMHQPLVDFLFERTVDAVELVEDSFTEAQAPEIEDLVNDIKGLYLARTRQGIHTPERVEEAGLLLLTALYHEVDRLEREYKRGPQLSASASVDTTPYETAAGSNMRSSKPGETNVVRIHYQFSKPAKAELELVLALELPKYCEGNDPVAVRCEQTGDAFEVRTADLIPKLSESSRFRIRMFAKQIFGKGLEKLLQLAKSTLANNGR